VVRLGGSDLEVFPLSVALAWVRAQPGVVAPIASARNTEQLAEILPGAGLELSEDELYELTEVSAPAPAS
jgi:aryl-alcohol dehydrogenase-like predicted oxidoreductase